MLSRNVNKSKNGFTLTEGLVSALIIGVISAIASPAYTKAINKSRLLGTINLLEVLRNKQVSNFARKAGYLPDFTAIGQLTGKPAVFIFSSSCEDAGLGCAL